MITIDIRESKKVNGDYAMFISFPYDNKIVDIIRNLPSRVWNADTKEWEVPINKLNVVTEKLAEYDFTITGKYVELNTSKPKAEVPADFKFKTNPFNHQIEGFNFGLQYDRWLLGDEQGLGKTKQVIDIAVAKKLQKCYRHCLIICGVNGLKWNWANEVKIHSNESARILGQKVKNGKIVIGSNADKYKDVCRIAQEDAGFAQEDYFLITNVETLRDEKISAKLSEMCKSGIIGMVAIDEVHKCKNPTSQQGKGILKIDAECKIAMTGTPLMNTPMDLYIILKWLGYEKHPFYAFKKHYCVMGGFGGYEVIGYKNLDELQEQLNEIMLRRLKDEVLDLPDKTYIDEYIDMTGKQEQIYKEVSADIKSNIDQISIAPNPLAQLIRLRQATGYTGILSSTVAESAKLDRLVELVEESVANNRKVVIFSNWTQMTDVIFTKLQKYGTELITGETADEHRQQAVINFQESKDCKVIIGTIGAMGTGLTLTAGTVVIFADHPWNRALYDQAVDRCHRIGQNNNITIYNLMCKNTIDERIWELVTKKGAMSDAIIDGKITGNRAELLDFLLS